MEIIHIPISGQARNTIYLGRVGENKVTTIRFDILEYVETFGLGNATIVHKLPNSTDYYPVSTTFENGLLTWVVRDCDLVRAGYGKAEIRYYVNDLLKKSVLIRTIIQDSLSGHESEKPSQVDSWIDDISKKVYGVVDSISQIKEDVGKTLDRVETKVEGGRVIPISNSVDIAQVYETAGCPEYIGNDDLSKYSSFGLTESGWYLFARINSRYGEFVSDGFSVVGASGVITPSIGSKYVDIAVRFGVVAESQKVVINWGTSEETFIFKATDLAIRNLDYRVTFYLYNIDDYCEWEYELTTDAKFVKDKGYYKLIDDEYVKQEVTIDETIPANTYYCHKSLVIKDFTRNMSYTLNTTVDCPVKIHLPEVGLDNYGAWFEVQMNFLQTYSVTIIPHTGQKVSANGVHSPKTGINIINILYHKPTNTWLPTVTNWAVSST